MDSLSFLNQPAPDFELTGIDGQNFHLADWLGQIVILNFWSAECTWSENADHEIGQYMLDWAGKTIWVSIASNANEPLDIIQQAALQRELPLVLHDLHQIVASLYHAQATPHAFVIDTAGIVRYQGAINDRTFRKHAPEHFYLRQAVEALLGGQLPDPADTPAYGCAVVYYDN